MGDDIGSGSVCFDFRSTNVVQLSNRKYVTGPEPMSLPINHLSYLKWAGSLACGACNFVTKMRKILKKKNELAMMHAKPRDM